MRKHFQRTDGQLELVQEILQFWVQSKALIVFSLLGIVTSIFWSPGLLASVSAGLPVWLLAISLFPLVACMVAVMIFAGTGLLAITLTALYELLLMPFRMMSGVVKKSAPPASEAEHDSGDCLDLSQ